jgi:GH25 family lysozyme M1 (1,4-beta-N-acetylmuramidase)
MDSLTVDIAPADGVAPQSKQPVAVNAVYTRVMTYDAANGVVTGLPQSIQDSVRFNLPVDLRSTVVLTAVSNGTDVTFQFLRDDGSVALAKVVSTGSSDSVKVTLTAADVAAILAQPAQPPPSVLQLTRRAQFVVVGDEQVSFDRCTLQVVPIQIGSTGWQSLGLSQIFHVDAPLTTSVPWATSLPSSLGALTWLQTHLAVDGSFSFAVPQGSGDAWLWWLTGVANAVGVVVDDLKLARTATVALALPFVSQSAATDDSARPPAAGSEAELANNPDIYTEDPGEFCRPFKNPERVLGERSFFVILRVEQPAISVEGSVRKEPLPVLAYDAVAKVEAAAASPALNAEALHAASLPLGAVSDDSAAASFVRHKLPAAYTNYLNSFDRGRAALDASHPIQWESDVSRYQAATAARGHILEFRMRWRSNGYSLGTVAKTLTLAPRQARRIQKIEWQRTEVAQREETTQLTDQVADSLSSSRDYDDAVQSNLSECAKGQSKSSESAAAGGFGFATMGFVIGGGGGGSSASSSSSQEGGRQAAASEEQQLRDSIRRYGDSLRKLESVVVSEVDQSETTTGTTEIVRNPNYGHSLTVIYYQILRHLKIETAVAGVRECLFVPFAITPFTVARVFRWRDFILKSLRDRQYAGAMQYLRDVATNFAYSDVPPGRRSDQPVRFIYGSLYIKLAIDRPRDKDDGSFQPEAWALVQPFLGQPALGIFNRLKAIDAAARDAEFQRSEAPTIAAAWVDTLQLRIGAMPLQGVDFTLATQYQFNTVVRVDFSATVPASVTRETLSLLQVTASRDLAPGSVANLQSLTFTYQTDQFQRTVSAAQGSGDLITVETGVRDPNGAKVSTIPDSWERRDVRAEMTAAVQGLVEHLNEHVEYYHKAIFWQMDRDRLFMLIDGFYAPSSNQVSIGSVVERDPIAIVGNSIVFRVSAGAFLGIGSITTPRQLLDYYVTTQAPTEPMLVSLPTDGLYAQTVMDECAGLEEHFGNTDWVLNDPDPALGDIAPELLQSRATTPPSTQPSPFPQTIINLQNAPEAPAPAGLSGALSAVTNANAFRDMAGLAGTQANASSALQTAANLATTFGNDAVALKMAQIAQSAHATQTADQKLATVQRAQDKGLATPETAQEHASRILDSLHMPAPSVPHQDPNLSQAIMAAAGRPGSTIQATTPDGQLSVQLASYSAAGSSGAAAATVAAAPAAPAPPAAVQNLPLGFDIYVYNGTSSVTAADFVALKNRGKVFGINKVSQGTALDGAFLVRHPMVRDAGLIRGTYAWFNDKPVADQTKVVIDNVKRLIPGDLAPAMDLEQDLNSTYGFGGLTNPAGERQLFADVKLWLDTIEAALGRIPIVYTWNVWKDRLSPQLVPDASDMNVYPLWGTQPELWNAVAASASTLPAWTKSSFWQYGEDKTGEKRLKDAALAKQSAGKMLTTTEQNQANAVTKLWGLDPYTEAPAGETFDGIDYDAFNGSIYELRGLADLGRPAVAIDDLGSARYIAHSEIGDVLHLITGPVWRDQDLTNDVNGSGADPVLLGNSTALFLYFRSGVHLVEATADAAGSWRWSTTDIEDGVAPIHDPRAVLSGTKRLVTYWGDDDDWHLVTWDGGWTSAGSLLSLAQWPSGTPGRSTGQPTVYVAGGAPHVVGRVDSGKLIDLHQNGAKWVPEDLIDLARASTPDVPLATYSPCVYQLSNDTFVVFRGVGGALWVIARATNSPTSLMTAVPTAKLACGHPTCFVLNGAPHVVYRGSDQLIYDLFQSGSQWQVAPVCSERAAADPVATANASVGCVAIRAIDGAIHLATFDGTQWSCEVAELPTGDFAPMGSDIA